jgi:hypothetical protein
LHPESDDDDAVVLKTGEGALSTEAVQGSPEEVLVYPLPPQPELPAGDPVAKPEAQAEKDQPDEEVCVLPPFRSYVLRCLCALNQGAKDQDAKDVEKTLEDRVAAIESRLGSMEELLQKLLALATSASTTKPDPEAEPRAETEAELEPKPESPAEGKD